MSTIIMCVEVEEENKKWQYEECKHKFSGISFFGNNRLMEDKTILMTKVEKFYFEWNRDFLFSDYDKYFGKIKNVELSTSKGIIYGRIKNTMSIVRGHYAAIATIMTILTEQEFIYYEELKGDKENYWQSIICPASTNVEYVRDVYFNMGTEFNIYAVPYLVPVEQLTEKNFMGNFYVPSYETLKYLKGSVQCLELQIGNKIEFEDIRVFQIIKNRPIYEEIKDV